MNAKTYVLELTWPPLRAKVDGPYESRTAAAAAWVGRWPDAGIMAVSGVADLKLLSGLELADLAAGLPTPCAADPDAIWAAIQAEGAAFDEARG